MELTQMAKQLEEITLLRKDLIVPDSQIVAGTQGFLNHATPILSIDGMPVQATSWAHSQIAAKTVIPIKYYDRMRTEAPALWAQSINRWMPQGKNRLARMIGDQLTAFMSDRYLVLDNHDVLFAVLGVFRDVAQTVGPITVQSADLSETKMYIRAIMPDRTYRLKDSEYTFGISIQNSDVGASSYRVNPYLWRVVCSNGMIGRAGSTDYSIERRHTGARVPEGVLSPETRQARAKAILGETQDITRACLTTDEPFRAMLGAAEEAMERQVIDMTGAVSAVGSVLNMSEDEKNSLLNLFSQEGPTIWGLTNGITALARDTGDADRATELEEGAWTVLTSDMLAKARVVADP